MTREEFIEAMQRMADARPARDPALDVEPGEVDMLTFLKLRVAGIEGWESETERVEAYAMLDAVEKFMREQNAKAGRARTKNRNAVIEAAKAALDARPDMSHTDALAAFLGEFEDEAERAKAERIINATRVSGVLQNHHKMAKRRG